MSAVDLKGIFKIGVDILTTTVNAITKKITAQTGDVVAEEPDSDNVEWWQHVGFASRPSKPNAGKEAAQAVVIRRGSQDVAVASQDLRGLSLYGSLAEGETCLYAAGEDGAAQGRVLLKADGSINLYTTSGNTAGGSSMGIFINPDGSISLASPAGSAVLMQADGSVKVFNSTGALQIGSDGVVKLSATSKLAIASPNVTVGSAALPLLTNAGMTAILAGIAAAVATIPSGASASTTIAALTSLLASPPNVTASFQAS